MFIDLDEATLEQRKVTKGARKKILQSIEKLIQRPVILRENEQVDETRRNSTVSFI